MKLHYVGEIIVTDSGISRIVEVGDYNGYTAEQIIPKDAFVEAFEKYICNPTVIACNPLPDEEAEKLIKAIQNQSLRYVETPHEAIILNRLQNAEILDDFATKLTQGDDVASGRMSVSEYEAVISALRYAVSYMRGAL